MRINYLEKIIIKSDAKKMKDSQISKIITAFNYCNILANSLDMITHFLQMSINQSIILRYNELYIKTTTNEN